MIFNDWSRVMTQLIDRIKKMSLVALLVSMLATSADAVDMFLSSTGNNTIYRVKDDGSYSPLSTSINSPTGITFGNGLFFVNSGGTKIVSLTWDGIVTDFITSGISNPSGLAYGRDGFLYIADSGSNTILKADSNGALTTFATGLSNPRGLTFDLQGNLYVTNGISPGSISKITPGGVRTTLTSGLNSPYGISFGSDNNLYVTTQADDSVFSVTLGGVATRKALGIASPTAVYLASNGELRAASSTVGTIYTVFSVAQITPFSQGFNSPSFIAVPEPSTYILGFTAVALLGFCRNRKLQKSK